MQPSWCCGDRLVFSRSGLGTCCDEELPTAFLPCFGELGVSCSLSWGLLVYILHLGSFETVHVDSMRVADTPFEKL